MADEPAEPAEKKSLNAFQVLGRIMSAAVGVRSGRERGRDLSRIGTGTLLLAVLIFATVGYGAMALFVHLVKAQVAS